VCAGQSLFNLVAVADGDHDMVVDEHDNCTAVPNPLQIDGDQDGYGNLCDADLNNDGGTGLDDVSEMLGLLNSSSPVGDLNGDGGVGMDDVVIVLGLMGTEPGPSSLICAGSVPCTSY